MLVILHSNGLTTFWAFKIDSLAPKITSIARLDANPSTAASLRFTVNFSEAVTGVDPADFKLTATGITGAAVTGVSGTGAARIVTIKTGTGVGTLRLDVLDNDSIRDSVGNCLGGTGLGNGNFTAGQKYTLDRNNQFTSIAAQDGWVLETAENSAKGGVLNATTNLLIGDDVANKQYLSLLSFNTTSLPDNATIVRITLKIRKAGMTGTDPFTTHGTLVADIQKGFFGTSSVLQPADFQAAASKNTAGTFTAVSGLPGWYRLVLGASNSPYINKIGLTQFRLRFTSDDNNDRGADYVSFFAGEAVAANRPLLIVEYTLP